MQIGLVLTGGSVRKDVELAQRAEAAGLDAVFTVEFFKWAAAFVNWLMATPN